MFFDAKHIKQNEKEFDKDFFKKIKTSSFAISDTTTEEEVSLALQKYKRNAKSFDNAGFYLSMQSRIGANAIQALTHLYKGCLETGSWVWRAAKIILLRKESKTSYASAVAYRPISLTPFIKKVLEKISP